MAFDFQDLSIDDPAITLGPVAGSYYQQADNHRLQFNDAGGTLAEALRRRAGPFSLDAVRFYGAELAAGLAHVHRRGIARAAPQIR